MAKKRKHSETKAAENEKKEETAPERPERTLFGFKTSPEESKENNSAPFFRNKEKVLVTCSRRISFRFNSIIIFSNWWFELVNFCQIKLAPCFYLISVVVGNVECLILSFTALEFDSSLYWICWLGDFRYRHLMMNLVDLLPHCKKDNKVESKGSKGTDLNELVELRSCSSCLFFEVLWVSQLIFW